MRYQAPSSPSPDELELDLGKLSLSAETNDGAKARDDTDDLGATKAEPVTWWTPIHGVPVVGHSAWHRRPTSPTAVELLKDLATPVAQPSKLMLPRTPIDSPLPLSGKKAVVASPVSLSSLSKESPIRLSKFMDKEDLPSPTKSTKLSTPVSSDRISLGCKKTPLISSARGPTRAHQSTALITPPRRSSSISQHLTFKSPTSPEDDDDDQWLVPENIASANLAFTLAEEDDMGVTHRYEYLLVHAFSRAGPLLHIDGIIVRHYVSADKVRIGLPPAVFAALKDAFLAYCAANKYPANVEATRCDGGYMWLQGNISQKKHKLRNTQWAQMIANTSTGDTPALVDFKRFHDSAEGRPFVVDASFRVTARIALRSPGRRMVAAADPMLTFERIHFVDWWTPGDPDGSTLKNSSSPTPARTEPNTPARPKNAHGGGRNSCWLPPFSDSEESFGF